MSLQVRVDTGQRVVICTFAGKLQDADILTIRSVVAAHPDFDPSFSEILDFTGVTATTVSTAVIQRVSERASRFNRESMHIFVAPQDFMFGLSRMTQMYAENTRPNVAVVRTMGEALAFLSKRDFPPN